MFRDLARAVASVPIIALATPAIGAAPSWTVDHATSRLGFAATMNGSGINGTFRRWATQIAFDPAHLDQSSVRVVIDTASASTQDATRDEALPTDDWFAAKTFPGALFVSRRFVALGGDRYRVIGNLRIRNMTHPVSIPFRLQITGHTARLTGSVAIDRTTFGVGQGQWAGTDAVAAKVDVVIAINARRTN